MWEYFGFGKSRLRIDSEKMDEEVDKIHTTAFDWFDRTSEMVKSFFRSSPGKLSSFSAGVSCAVFGAIATYRNKEFVRADSKLLRVLIRELLTIYAIALIFIIIFWPIFIALVLLSPGIITNAMNLSALYAFKRAKSGHKHQFNDLFTTELGTLAPKLAGTMEENMIHKESLFTTSRHNWHLARYSFFVNLLGLLPVIGTILAPVGQTLLTSEHLGWNLLKPYLVDYKGYGYSVQKAIIYKNWYMIIGFATPYVLLSSIPFLSLYVTGLAQAGASHLLLEIIHRNNDEDLALAFHIEESDDEMKSVGSRGSSRKSSRRSSKSNTSTTNLGKKKSSKLDVEQLQRTDSSESVRRRKRRSQRQSVGTDVSNNANESNESS